MDTNESPTPAESSTPVVNPSAKKILAPSRIGSPVRYCLNESDARAIIESRRQAGIGTARGNEPREGDVFPGIIVRDFAQAPPNLLCDRGTAEQIAAWFNQAVVNIQVFLDGNDVFWATSRAVFYPESDVDARGKYVTDGWAPGPQVGDLARKYAADGDDEKARALALNMRTLMIVPTLLRGTP